MTFKNQQYVSVNHSERELLASREYPTLNSNCQWMETLSPTMGNRPGHGESPEDHTLHKAEPQSICWGWQLSSLMQTQQSLERSTSVLMACRGIFR